MRNHIRKLATLVSVALATTAHAEGRIRIAEQYGVVYLILQVAQAQKLIEKHGKAQGVDVQVEFMRLSGGSAVNDALLSGQIDIAGADPAYRSRSDDGVERVVRQAMAQARFVGKHVDVHRPTQPP